MRNNRGQSRAVVTASIVLILGACGSRAESVCKASIKDTLLNPETAQFLDFESISKGTAKYAMSKSLASEHELPSGMTSSIVEGALDKGEKSAGNLEYYRVRVRAEGKLGNTVTQQNICILASDGCACTDVN